jgi:hypothetical protein
MLFVISQSQIQKAQYYPILNLNNHILRQTIKTIKTAIIKKYDKILNQNKQTHIQRLSKYKNKVKTRQIIIIMTEINIIMIIMTDIKTIIKAIMTIIKAIKITT